MHNSETLDLLFYTYGSVLVLGLEWGLYGVYIENIMGYMEFIRGLFGIYIGAISGFINPLYEVYMGFILCL